MVKKKLTFGEIRVIECNEISFAEKDLINITNIKDFKFLTFGGSIFKLKNSYYLISLEVIFVWVDK